MQCKINPINQAGEKDLIKIKFSILDSCYGKIRK